MQNLRVRGEFRVIDLLDRRPFDPLVFIWLEIRDSCARSARSLKIGGRTAPKHIKSLWELSGSLLFDGACLLLFYFYLLLGKRLFRRGVVLLFEDTSRQHPCCSIDLVIIEGWLLFNFFFIIASRTLTHLVFNGLIFYWFEYSRKQLIWCDVARPSNRH